MQSFHKIHPSWCFYAGVFGVIFGVAISLALKISVFEHLLWLILAVIFFIISILRPCRFCAALAFLAGFLIANFRLAPELKSQDYLSSLIGQAIIVSGKISEDPDLGSKTPTVRLSQLELYFDVPEPVENPVENSQSTSVKLAGTLYVRLSSPPDLERSDIITLKGKLGEGFGTFAGSFYRPEIINISRAPSGDIFARFKNAFAARVHEHLASPASDLGLSYLMGMKSGLSDDFSDALSAVGMTHVVVASGAHLAILVGAARKIFGKISRFASLMFGIIAIFAFALVVGFTPSMTRAVLVALLSLIAGFVGRKFTPLRLISLVAATTLLISPIYLFHLGWQLSFASFFGILVVSPRLSKLLYGDKTPPWLASMLITSLSTTLVCAPILIYNFGSISLLSFIANLIILPTLPYVMFLTLLIGVTSFLPFLASLVARLAELLLNLHIWLVEFLQDKTAFIIEIPAASPLIFLLYLPLLIFLIWPRLTKIYRSFAKPTKYVIMNT